jgi:SpoVK/Ycf46/Vps4 family AAA+-type ATPase
MEQRMRKVFSDARNSIDSGIRTILLFDDIDTLLMSRDDNRSQEWTVSLNATFFHEVDRLRTTKTMICATTNKTDMLDDAVKSRLWLEEAPAPTLDEMKTVAKSALPIGMVNGKTPEELLSLAGERIEHHLEKEKPASFRLARMAGIEVLIREVIGWE